MKKMAILRIICLSACLTLLCFSQANGLSTRDRILSEIGFSSTETYTVIKISFNFPVRYLRHYPLNYGKEVRVQLEPIIVSRDDREALNKRESLIPPANNPVGVTRVEYEGSDFVEPTIRVVFDKAVSYEAKQGDDYRSLVVLVPKKVSDTTAVPDIKVEKEVSKEEKTEAVGPSAKKGTEVAEAGPGRLSAKRQESLLSEGVKVMVEKNYSRAIQVYTKLLESSDEKVQELAQYQLALAQEKIGHLAHAKAEYKNYLRSYPEGESAEEAHDRLKNLLRARPIRLGTPTDTLGREESFWESEFFGSISVFYDRDESFLPDEEVDEDEDSSVVNFSILTTGVDATWRLQSDDYRFEVVAIGSFEGDLEDDDNETRASSLYFDFEDHAGTISTRLGRQSGSKGGVLGRFDGARFGYLLTEKIRVNVVAGYPVDRSSDELQTDKYFYGINFDLGRFWDHWDFNTYVINQISDGIDDRRAIGGEVRYVGKNGSFFSLLDYDLLYNEVNIFLFAGNYLLPNEKTRLNLSADFRSSPSLSTSNAQIGQISPSLEALQASLGETALRQLARDRTLDSSFVTLGVSHPLSDNIQIAGDVSWSKLDGAPASGGVEEIESTGDEFYYTLQLIGNGLVKSGDISSLSLRYADTRQRDTYTFTLNSRYPINDMWRITPKLQVDFRENKILSGSQWRLRPGLRIECLIGKNLRFEIDGEYSWADEELEGIAEDRKGYSLSAGFRWDF